MNIKIICFLSLCLAIMSCSILVKTDIAPNNFSSTNFLPLDESEQIFLLKVNEDVKSNIDFVGKVKIGDGGFTIDCGYKIVQNLLINKARDLGANIVKLTKVKPPGFASECYRVKANLYRSNDKSYLEELGQLNESRYTSRLDIDVNHAMVYFYRPKRFSGSLINYKIYGDDSETICQMKNGNWYAHKVKEFRKHKYFALNYFGQNEYVDSVEIDIEKGQEYFVRCGNKPSFPFARPTIHVIDNEDGIKQYESLAN